MIDVVLQVLGEIVINPIGGVIRWAIFRKKPLKHYVSGNWEANVGFFSFFRQYSQ